MANGLPTWQARGLLVSGKHPSYRVRPFRHCCLLPAHACSAQGQSSIDRSPRRHYCWRIRSCCKIVMEVTVILLFLCIWATSPVSIHGRNGVGAVVSDGENGTRLTETLEEQRQGVKPKTNTDFYRKTVWKRGFSRAPLN